MRVADGAPPPAWQTLLKQVITSPKELFELLELDGSLLESIPQGKDQMPLRVPRGFVARMKKSDPNDPLLRQIIPMGAELEDRDGYLSDPLKESDRNPLPGLLHKFYGRVLIITTGACAVHCRYCFRQHFPYAANNPGTKGWEKIMDYIRQDSSIFEVILSGGDPLVLPDARLRDQIVQLQEIAHLRLLRLHTRMPIVLPERVCPELLSWLHAIRLKTVIVVHCNHAQELNSEVKEAMGLLRQAGVTLLNQTVLLKGVNDTVDALVDLSVALFDCGILPYYLFTLDKVQGTAHFDLPLTEAKALHKAMAARLPGYLVPKLAQEVPGEPAKVAL